MKRQKMRLVSKLLSISLIALFVFPTLFIPVGAFAAPQAKEKIVVPEDSPHGSTAMDAYDDDLYSLAAEAQAARENAPSSRNQGGDPEELARISERVEAALSIETELRAEISASKSNTKTSKAQGRQTSPAAPLFGGGSGTESDPYIIISAEHLQNIASSADAYFRLDSDIDLASVSWTPICDSAAPFTGNLDGDGHTISNLLVVSTDTYTGLFRYALGATIQNLTIESASISGAARVGAFAGQANDCTLSMLTLGSDVVVRGTGMVGGIVGVASNAAILDCTNNGQVNSAGAYAGGIVSALVDGEIRDSAFTGFLEGRNYTGGLAGALYGHAYMCTNTGDVTGTTTVGGIAGELSFVNRVRNVNYCYNAGTILGTSEVGGIAGYALSTVLTSTISASVIANANTGEVYASGSYAGGIIGGMTCNAFIISSYNRGEIRADVSYAGGIAGRFNPMTTTAYFASGGGLYNTGRVSAGSAAGAIAGYNYALSISNSHYLSEQPAGYQVPGITAGKSSAKVYARTAAELRALVSTLGTRYLDDTGNINDGYPILNYVNYSVDSIPKRESTGFFYYGSSFGDTTEDSRAMYYYSDDYFGQSSYTYNEHLATMSLSYALSAFGSQRNPIRTNR